MKRKGRRSEKKSVEYDVEPDGLNMALSVSNKKGRTSPKHDDIPALYKESLGTEGIKVRDTSAWSSQATNSFSVKLTKLEKKRRDAREARFTATPIGQTTNSEKESSDDEEDNAPKGLSSSLSSSRMPGVTLKKRNNKLVGTNRNLEKSFLRLTTFPKACDVRPLSVLRKSLKHIKEGYIKDEDFAWANEQLKSVRQDITVQGLKSAFVLDVYETHARILLEHGDLNEFNQCQTMIHTLTTGAVDSEYDSFGEDSEFTRDDRCGTNILLSQTDEQNDEFAGYRLLYSLVQNADLNKSLTQTRLTVKEKMEDHASSKPSSCLHAMNVVKAVIHSDYRYFFRLYDSAPHLSAFLMDFLVKRVRDAAFERIMAAYRPSIGAEEIRTSLNFEDLKETRKFLKQSGAVFIKEKGEPRFWIDCKASKKLL